jgi:hypothetical protein
MVEQEHHSCSNPFLSSLALSLSLSLSLAEKRKKKKDAS